MDWENYRRSDGTIDIHRAYRESFGGMTGEVSMYLGLIETFQPVRSRQLAAQALATANAIFEKQP